MGKKKGGEMFSSEHYRIREQCWMKKNNLKIQTLNNDNKNIQEVLVEVIASHILNSKDFQSLLVSREVEVRKTA